MSLRLGKIFKIVNFLSQWPDKIERWKRLIKKYLNIFKGFLWNCKKGLCKHLDIFHYEHISCLWNFLQFTKSVGDTMYWKRRIIHIIQPVSGSLLTGGAVGMGPSTVEPIRIMPAKALIQWPASWPTDMLISIHYFNLSSSLTMS